MEMSTNLSARALEDFTLVKEAQSGSQSAYKILMDRYREQVYMMMFKIVKNKDDADDLVLEAFGKAFRSLDSYTPNFAFSTWLFRIATNNCIDFVRKRRLNTYSIDQNIESDSKQEFSSTLKSDNLDPEENFMYGQKIKTMQKVILQLPEKYRRILVMRYYEELSYQEIAHEEDIPLGTVKAQLFRAKELLLDLVQQSTESR
jgi:RNA polymerase sigma factor (sigma-70 family)